MLNHWRHIFAIVSPLASFASFFFFRMLKLVLLPFSLSLSHKHFSPFVSSVSLRNRFVVANTMNFYSIKFSVLNRSHTPRFIALLGKIFFPFQGLGLLSAHWTHSVFFSLLRWNQGSANDYYTIDSFSITETIDCEAALKRMTNICMNKQLQLELHVNKLQLCGNLFGQWLIPVLMITSSTNCDSFEIIFNPVESGSSSTS